MTEEGTTAAGIGVKQGKHQVRDSEPTTKTPKEPEPEQEPEF